MKDFETETSKAKNEIFACIEELYSIIEEIPKENDEACKKAMINYCHVMLYEIKKSTYKIND